MAGATVTVETKSKQHLPAGTRPENQKMRRAGKRAAERRYALWWDMNWEAQQELRALLKDPSPQIRLGAIKEIFDRTDGRPRQQAQIEVKADTLTLHLDALRALVAQPTDLIDISPSAVDG